MAGSLTRSQNGTDRERTRRRTARQNADVDDSQPLAIVDIDGVVADVRHRLRHIERGRKNWKAFFAAAADDAIHHEGVAIVETLRAGHEVVFVTGRPEHLRKVTETWLQAAGLGGHRLLMRSDRDHRPAPQLKREIIAGLARGRTIGIVVDDDPKVLALLSSAGYPTFAASWERRSTDERAALESAQDREGLT